MNVAQLAPLIISDQMALPLFLHSANDESDADLTGPAALDLGAHLVRRPRASGYTYANDDSMQAFGVNDGDLLIVDRSIKPQDGDLVIARLEQDILCRSLDMRESCLRAGADGIAPIRLNEQVEVVIEGVVTFSVRQQR